MFYVLNEFDLTKLFKGLMLGCHWWGVKIYCHLLREIFCALNDMTS